MPRGRPRGSTVLAICAIAVTGLLGAGAAVGSALASPPSTSVPLGLASPPSPDGSARGGASERASAAPLADEAEAEPEDEDEAEPEPEPATKAAAKILALRTEVLASLTETTYQHHTVIKPREGVYKWDCSAMGAWFLRKAAPVARKALNKGRPVARDFHRHIARSSTRRTREGWRRLAHIEDVRPGDVFAWVRPPGFPSRNTGHMGFALEPARPVPGLAGAYTLRIFDATSLPHQDDTRERGSGGGIGEGTILFLTDNSGRGTAYGWFGVNSRGVIETDIVFGRVSR